MQFSRNQSLFSRVFVRSGGVKAAISRCFAFGAHHGPENVQVSKYLNFPSDFSVFTVFEKVPKFSGNLTLNRLILIHGIGIFLFGF